MKKGYLKLLILIFFAILIFSGNSYGIEIKSVQLEEEPQQTIITTEPEEKEEPEEGSTVILFTIQEVAEDNDTEQAEDCSAITDAKKDERQNEVNSNTKDYEPVKRDVIKRRNTTNIKTRDNTEFIQAIDKIISKLYNETENIRQFINTSNDKKAKIQKTENNLAELVIKPIRKIGNTIKNNLLYIQKYADNQEYNRLSC